MTISSFTIVGVHLLPSKKYPNAKHNEAAWRKYFPDFYEWTT
ncbi:MAG TPA: hypothetical protein VMU83_03250 [Hanamia sp.]|nr:hypothetical protein [Hanamia sp.]